MSHPHSPATRILLEASAASLHLLAAQIDHCAGLVKPPGHSEWSGPASEAFSNAIHDAQRRVIAAADLTATAERYAAAAAGQA